MFKLKDFSSENYDSILHDMKIFYKSSAVDHEMEDEVIEKLLNDILSKKRGVKGLEIYMDECLVGFSVITYYYATEVAGKVMQLEDIFVKPEYRNKGVGSWYIQYMINHNKDVKRFRLEVASDNKKAQKLYKSLGFEKIGYVQMVLDK